MGRYLCRLTVTALCCGLLGACSADSRSPTAATSPVQTRALPPPTDPPPGGFTVSGIVSEIVGGQTVPLEGVHVEDSERHVFVKSGADGGFTITEVAVSSFGGAYIYFAKPGYTSQVRQFPLTGNTRVDVVLVRQ